MNDALTPTLPAYRADIRIMLGKVPERPETRIAHNSPRQSHLCRFGVHRLV